MAADGVSLQTNLVQLGNLAKAQSRGQTAAQGPNAAPELQKQDVAAVDRVRETEKAEQDGIDKDKDNQKGRRRRRGEPHEPAAPDSDQEQDLDAEQAAEQDPGLGGLIDIKA